MGPVNVWIRPPAEADFLCRLCLRNVPRSAWVLGCYLPDTQTIIAVADPYILAHEFRHHFEGPFHP